MEKGLNGSFNSLLETIEANPKTNILRIYKQSIKKIIMNCFVCGSTMSEKMHKYNDFAWNKSELFINLSIYHCDNCGLGFSFPDLALDDLGFYYSKIYRAKNSPFYFDFNKDVSKRIKISYSLAGDRGFSQILLARFFTDFKNGDILLDIGPGKGGTFGLANLLLSNPKLYGIELRIC